MSTQKRTAGDFVQAVEQHGITFWPIHRCVCDYQCGYVFSDGQVAYDSGCFCSAYGPSAPRPADYHDVATLYNMQAHPNAIARFDAFWHFGVSAEEVS